MKDIERGKERMRGEGRGKKGGERVEKERKDGTNLNSYLRIEIFSDSRALKIFL